MAPDARIVTYARRSSPRRPSCPPSRPPPFLQPHSCRCVGPTPTLHPRAHAPVAPRPRRREGGSVPPATPPRPALGHRGRCGLGWRCGGNRQRRALAGGGGGGWGTPKERPFAQPSHRTCWHSNKRVHGDPTQQQSSGTAMQCILDIPAARGEEERGGGGLALVSSPHVGTDTEADAGTSAVPSCGWVRRGFHCGRVERVQQQPKTLVCCSTLVLLAGPPGGGPGGVADPVGAPSPALLHRTCQWRTHSRRPAVGWFWKILPH